MVGENNVNIRGSRLFHALTANITHIMDRSVHSLKKFHWTNIYKAYHIILVVEGTRANWSHSPTAPVIEGTKIQVGTAVEELAVAVLVMTVKLAVVMAMLMV